MNDFNYREVILKPIEYVVHQWWDKDELNYCRRPEITMEHYGRKLSIQLKNTIWAQNLEEKEVCKVPIDWFNHLKEHLYNKYKKYWTWREIARKFPVKYKVYTANLNILYPEIEKESLPDKQKILKFSVVEKNKTCY